MSVSRPKSHHLIVGGAVVEATRGDKGRPLPQAQAPASLRDLQSQADLRHLSTLQPGIRNEVVSPSQRAVDGRKRAIWIKTSDGFHALSVATHFVRNMTGLVMK